jgi:hypothetical protein
VRRTWAHTCAHHCTLMYAQIAPKAAGTAVAMLPRMTNTTPKASRQASTTEPTPVLRWVFHRGGHALTCAVEATADQSSYDVCVLPHWNLSIGTVEQFMTATSAMRRHAEVAAQLRQSGWVAEYRHARS